jgi:hypothetical protein
MADYIESLTKAVRAMHGFPCRRLRTSHVHEMLDGKTVWQGSVETFTIEGHPKATEAYAWGWDDDGEVRYIAVLNVLPINSPREAVQAAIASGRQR